MKRYGMRNPNSENLQVPEQPRRSPGQRLLTGAPMAAFAALAVAPLGVAMLISAPSGTTHPAATYADKCDIAVTTGLPHTLKWPACAGD